MKIIGHGVTSVDLKLEIIDELPLESSDGADWKIYLAIDKEGNLYEVFTWPPHHNKYMIAADSLEHLAISR